MINNITTPEWIGIAVFVGCMLYASFASFKKNKDDE